MVYDKLQDGTSNSLKRNPQTRNILLSNLNHHAIGDVSTPFAPPSDAEATMRLLRLVRENSTSTRTRFGCTTHGTVQMRRTLVMISSSDGVTHVRDHPTGRILPVTLNTPQCHVAYLWFAERKHAFGVTRLDRFCKWLRRKASPRVPPPLTMWTDNLGHYQRCDDTFLRHLWYSDEQQVTENKYVQRG